MYYKKPICLYIIITTVENMKCCKNLEYENRYKLWEKGNNNVTWKINLFSIDDEDGNKLR